jgi:hypothetical protein
MAGVYRINTVDRSARKPKAETPHSAASPVAENMSGKMLVKAYHTDDASAKKRVAILASDEWQQVLEKLQTKFGMPGMPTLVEADGAAVEGVDELCDGDILVVHGARAADGSVSAPVAASAAAPAAAEDVSAVEAASAVSDAVDAFYKRNMLHTTELLGAVKLVRRFVESSARPDPKFRRANFALPRPAAAFGPPISGARQLLLAVGYKDEGAADAKPPCLVLPAGSSVPPAAVACLAELEQRLLPYVTHVVLSSAGSAAVKAVRAGLIVPKEGSKDAGGALRTSASTGGADAMERLEAARQRLRAVSRAGHAEASSRGFAAPEGLERAFHDAAPHARSATGGDDDDGESAASAGASAASAASAAGAAGAASAASAAAPEVLDREALRSGLSLFRHLSQAGSGRGRLEELAMRMEARAEQAEKHEACTVRLDLPAGRRVVGSFRLDEPVESVLHAATELCHAGRAEAGAMPKVVLQGAGGTGLELEQSIAAAVSGDRIAFRVRLAD